MKEYFVELTLKDCKIMVNFDLVKTFMELSKNRKSSNLKTQYYENTIIYFINTDNPLIVKETYREIQDLL